MKGWKSKMPSLSSNYTFHLSDTFSFETLELFIFSITDSYNYNCALQIVNYKCSLVSKGGWLRLRCLSCIRIWLSGDIFLFLSQESTKIINTVLFSSHILIWTNICKHGWGVGLYPKLTTATPRRHLHCFVPLAQMGQALLMEILTIQMSQRNSVEVCSQTIFNHLQQFAKL